MAPSGPARLEIPCQMEQWISSFLRPRLQTELELFALALGREAAAASCPSPQPGCAFLGHCPALHSSWNQSAHLLKKPLHQRSPGSCWPPGAARLGLYRIFEIADLCLGRAPQRVPGTPAQHRDFTTVWRGQEETLPESTVIQELTLKQTL